MARFDDYHRTVIGYHGTGLSAALRIVNRIEKFRKSERDYDWLGRGIYFWEYAPKQAMRFAKIRQRQFLEKTDKSPEDHRRATEPLAVVACMIRLGYCLDLTEPGNIQFLSEVYKEYEELKKLGEADLPKNSRKFRKLDCEVFEYAYKCIQDRDPKSSVDTARGIYVPTDRAKRLWAGSWISRETHIQLCVRNTESLLGAWLHEPGHLEVRGVCETLQAGDVGLQPADPQSQSASEEDVDAAKN